MKTLKALIMMCVALAPFAIQAQESEQAKASDLKKVAIFVRNDSGKTDLVGKDKFLENAIAARLNNMGFGVISQDLVVRNLNAYLGDPNAKYRSEAETFKRKVAEESLDSKLFESASGLRLAEIIGADYIMAVSYAGFTSETKTFSGYGVDTVNILFNLRSTYTLSESGAGIGTAGGAIKSSKSVRQTADLETVSDDILDSLIDDTAEQMASLMKKQKQAGQIIAKEDSAGQVNIQFVIEAMSFPEIIKNDKGDYIVGTTAIPATITYVNAEIDGVSQTIGGPMALSKGLHTFKINQKDIAPVEKNIFVTNDPKQTITFTLSLSDEARLRWKQDMVFIDEMKSRAMESDNKRMLTETEVARIRGIAKMYENSGFKVDVKVDADNLPDIHQSQSVFGQ